MLWTIVVDAAADASHQGQEVHKGAAAGNIQVEETPTGHMDWKAKLDSMEERLNHTEDLPIAQDRSQKPVQAWKRKLGGYQLMKQCPHRRWKPYLIGIPSTPHAKPS